jgi:fucose permease
MASGMALAAIGIGLFAQLGVHSSYAAHLLPPLLVLGVGLGFLYAPATDIATCGVDPGDAGIASGLVNATNQVGGSLGLALLSTLGATAPTDYLAGKRPTPTLIAHAAVHGYTSGFWRAAGFFVAGALIIGLLLHGRAPAPAPQPGTKQSSNPPAHTDTKRSQMNTSRDRANAVAAS